MWGLLVWGNDPVKSCLTWYLLRKERGGTEEGDSQSSVHFEMARVQERYRYDCAVSAARARFSLTQRRDGMMDREQDSAERQSANTERRKAQAEKRSPALLVSSVQAAGLNRSHSN